MENGHSLVSQAWVVEQLFLSSKEYFEELIQSCRRAQRSIDIEVYMLVQDEVGNGLLSELRQASERGVSVRVLVDGIGSPHWLHGMLEELPHKGVETRIYHPVANFQLSGWRNLLNLPLFWRLLKVFYYINRRDHKKVFLFDDQTAFVGGINISRESLEWQDVGVKLEGPGVEDLVSAFSLNWSRSTAWDTRPVRRIGEARRVAKFWNNPYVELNHTLKLRRKRMQRLIERIDNARERVWMVNPYWVPGPLLIRSLIRASRRGVDVRLCFPADSDIFFTPWVGEILLAPLIPCGVKLFEYQRGFIHAKFLLIDSWNRLGSTNLNYRSQYHDLEADIILVNASNVAALAARFREFCQSSKLISVQDISRRPWVQKVLGRFILIFKRWM